MFGGKLGSGVARRQFGPKRRLEGVVYDKRVPRSNLRLLWGSLTDSTTAIDRKRLL